MIFFELLSVRKEFDAHAADVSACLFGMAKQGRAFFFGYGFNPAAFKDADDVEDVVFELFGRRINTDAHGRGP